MHSKIKKRDGRLVKFNAEKITQAIAKAGAATGEFDFSAAKMLTIRVLNLAEKVFDSRILTVEEIQDIVEEVLLSSPYRKTAKAYIIYRDQHARLREITNRMEVDLVDQYLKKMDWKINENSNMDYSLQGLNNYISSEVSKVYWLNEIYSPEIRRAHTEGDFHIHDLSLLSVYCVGWDLFDLLMEGFRGVSGKVESKPAKHLRSALGQVVNFFYTLQGEAAGAQAFSNFDTLLAPFIRYDKLTYPEIRQALQEFIFNINVPTRVGFQTPFTNVTLDIKVPRYYADRNVIVGGEAAEGDLRRFSGGDESFQQGLSPGDGGRRRQGAGLYLPHSHLQHHKGFRLGRSETRRAMGNDGEIRGPLFFQFRQFGHESGRCQEHVLSSADRQSRAPEARRGPLWFQPLDGIHRRHHDQHAQNRLSGRYGRGIYRTP